MSPFLLDRFPVPVSLDEYDSTADAIEKQFTQLPGLVSIYRLGGVSAPGISDLDRLAVVSGTGPYRTIWPSLTERERYVALHTPFLADLATFTSHRWFSYLEPLELRSGEAICVEDPPELALLRRRIGIEALLFVRVWLEKIFFTQRIDVRSLLCILHNLRHDLSLVGLSRSATPTTWHVVDEVEFLRVNWWSLEPTERVSGITRLTSDSVVGLRDALAQCGETGASAKAQESLLLGDYWRNVELTAGLAIRRRVGQRVLAMLSRRSRRAAELHWRLRSRRVCVPAGVIATLNHANDTKDAVFRIRHEHLARYRAFLSSNPGWSAISLAGAFDWRQT